ncbi:AcrR family transcriptional regulator [Microbacterium terrae]|uniref:HTH-type transcriptional regulator BetI n=1 Tax=Microbacterium terrae TaxID=69369 RepID=A0A0M2H4Y0_9MICO|nr:TetR family transcriptional regulator C-terminal domain-containing protein [Microbacterium terrae]KJL38797.1 HTH-type transcriptional regulator BetI [Microbacterium terrae]MBP1076216.1 AcrR family transcriptional regulator [Microbacterium terrae]GLJ97037.1 transcriptional regulator [Microbacterium terrae]
MSSTDARIRTRKAPAERAAEIADAATALARDQGLSALTQRAVAERAGVAPALISHYHPSMDDLVAGAYTALVVDELGDVATLLAAERGASARFARLLDTLLDGTREDLTVVWVEGWAMALRIPALADAVRVQMAAWQRLLVEVIDEGTRAGEFSVTDVAEVAWQLMGMIDGLNAQSLARDTDPGRAVVQMARAAEALLGATPGSLGPAG